MALKFGPRSQAFHHGYIKAEAGHDRRYNDYRKGTRQYVEWLQGWKHFKQIENVKKRQARQLGDYNIWPPKMGLRWAGSEDRG